MRKALILLLVFCVVLYGAYINGSLTIEGNLIFEGSTADGNETTVAVTDPTADRTWTIPDGSDTFAGLSLAQTFATGLKTVTSKFDFGGGTLEVPNSNTLPGTCAVGDSYMDTDATSGQRWYLCESTNTWVLQGGSGGGEIELFNYYGSLGLTSSGSQTTVLQPGCYSTSITAGFSGTSPSALSPSFSDNASEILWCKTIISPNADMTDVSARFGVKSATTSATLDLDWAVSCPATNFAIATNYTSITGTTVGALQTTASGTAHGLVYMELLNQDISAECSPGDVAFWIFTVDDTASTGAIDIVAGRIWSEL